MTNLSEIEALIFNKDRNGVEIKQKKEASLCEPDGLRHNYYRHEGEHRSFCTFPNSKTSRLTSSHQGQPCPWAKGASYPDRGRPDDARKYTFPGEADKGALLRCDYSNLDDNTSHSGFILLAIKKPPSGGPKVTLHENENFGGVRRDFGQGPYNLSDEKYQPAPQHKKVKSWFQTRRWNAWDNSVSSLQIGPFTKLEMWENDNFTGKKVEWINDTSEWRKFPDMSSHWNQPSYYNNYASSMKISSIPSTQPEFLFNEANNFNDTEFVKNRNLYDVTWNHLADEYQLVDTETNKPISIQDINTKSFHKDKKYRIATKDNKYEILFPNNKALGSNFIPIQTNKGSIFTVNLIKENVIRIKELNTNRLLVYEGLTDFTIIKTTDTTFRLKSEYTIFEQYLHYVSTKNEATQYAKNKDGETVFQQLKNIYCDNSKNLNKVVDLNTNTDGIVKTCVTDKDTRLSQEKVEAYCLQNPTDLKCACYNKNTLGDKCTEEKNKNLPGCKEYNEWSKNMDFLSKSDKGKQLLNIVKQSSNACVAQNVCEVNTDPEWQYGSKCEAPTNIQACIQGINNATLNNKGNAVLSNECNLSLENEKMKNEKEKMTKFNDVKTDEQKEYENAGKPQTTVEENTTPEENKKEDTEKKNNLAWLYIILFIFCVGIIAMIV